MDLKRVQEELKSDIFHHQTLMQQLKKDPLNNALKLKLKAVQQHIAELGSRQKKILSVIKPSNQTLVPAQDDVKNHTHRETSSSSDIGTRLTEQNAKQMNGNTLESAASHIQPTASGTNPSYTLITIKNRPRPSISSSQGNPVQPENLPINLTCLPKMSPPVLMVSAPNQNKPNSPIIRTAVPAKSVPLSISLSSLVSTGGVVTLAGGWKGPTQSIVGSSNDNSMVDGVGRIVPGKPVQIKVPVVQSPGTSPLILMQQKPASSQSKSLFRLLPKGRHPIPINQVTRQNVVSKGLQFVSTSSQPHAMRAPIVTPKPLPTLLVSKERNSANPQKYQQVVLQRTINPMSTSVSASVNSVTWQDLSCKASVMHKPSYVPMKTFPNMNNGVGSFQKFRILDGKTRMLPKSGQDMSVRTMGMAASSSGHVTMEKPRNAALKAVLTSSRPTTSTGMVTVARLVPTTVPKNGFYPILPQGLCSKQMTPSLKHQFVQNPKGSSFLPVSISAAVASSTALSSFRAMNDSPTASASSSAAVNDEEMKKKLGFLRNLDLIPQEQADKVRNRRFRKRRVAANPIYSGGMYVSNEVEPKRHCPDVLMGALDGITPPDVIVKRPRGRPRGSTKSASPAQLLQQLTSSKSARSSAGSPVTPAHMEELRQLRGILDVVASASKAVSASASVGTKGVESERQSLRNTGEEATMSKLLAALDGKVPKTEGKSVNVKDTNGEHEDEHEDQCATCGRTGEVLMCDTCSRVYHLACTTPPLTNVPQGMWVCSKCKTEFKASKSEVEWPGIVHAVHSYVDYNKQRDKDLETEKERLQQSKKLINGLQAQTKALTSVVMGKVNLRSKAMKEKQCVHKEMVDTRNLLRSVWNLAVHGQAQPL